MNARKQSYPSAYDQMVEKLRDKSEAELKMLYMKFFSKELEEEWKKLTIDSDFGGATEKEIINAIQKRRYRN